jgi:hypothetical protein
MKFKNEIRFLDDKTIEIILTKGMSAIIDADDYDKISGYTWIANYQKSKKEYRAVARKKGKGNYKIYMHRVIMGIKDKSIFVDHINHNQLDNRKINLRECTISQNNKNIKMKSSNKTGYKGVYFSIQRNKYIAQIQCDKKTFNLGGFKTAKEAAKIYDNYAAILFGEFALLNFKRDNYQSLNKEA